MCIPFWTLFFSSFCQPSYRFKRSLWKIRRVCVCVCVHLRFFSTFTVDWICVNFHHKNHMDSSSCFPKTKTNPKTTLENGKTFTRFFSRSLIFWLKNAILKERINFTRIVIYVLHDREYSCKYPYQIHSDCFSQNQMVKVITRVFCSKKCVMQKKKPNHTNNNESVFFGQQYCVHIEFQTDWRRIFKWNHIVAYGDLFMR